MRGLTRACIKSMTRFNAMELPGQARQRQISGRSEAQGEPMTLRADHVAGAAFIALGLAIVALSGDLPMGGLSMPGSGFLPILVAALLILFGIVLAVRAGESEAFSRLEW